MLKPKKSLSQNFLIDKNVAQKIVRLLSIKDNNIIEIGPGKGALTFEILKMKPKKLILIEKDDYLCQLLEKKLNNKKNILILNQDFLDYKNYFNEKYQVISNLPYNVSVKIILKLLKDKKYYSNLILMVQKEVAMKMNYHSNFKNNLLNFIIEILSDYKIMFNVSNNVFFPKPKINSTIIHIKPKKLEIDFLKFYKFSRKIFSKKRKKISNIIDINQSLLSNKNLLNLRAEDIKSSDLFKLFNLF